MVSRNQRLRSLQAGYLKLRWKINKYEKFESLTEKGKHGEVFIRRIASRLEGFRQKQEELWSEIVEIHKGD